MPGERLGAWALDEYKAYRQIPIDPEERKFAVVAVVNPRKGPDGVPRPQVEYFVMNGHCFGFTNAVYNYCRRPMALHCVLDKLFGVVSD